MKSIVPQPLPEPGVANATLVAREFTGNTVQNQALQPLLHRQDNFSPDVSSFLSSMKCTQGGVVGVNNTCVCAQSMEEPAFLFGPVGLPSNQEQARFAKERMQQLFFPQEPGSFPKLPSCITQLIADRSPLLGPQSGFSPLDAKPLVSNY